MRISLTILFLNISTHMTLVAQTGENGKPLTAEPGENWVIKWNRSDDFKGDQVNWKMWNKKPEKFSGWSWDNDKNVSVADGVLTLTVRRGDDSAFHSAMLKSYSVGTYGYYEARIKGASLFPGVSPAFWLYSRIDDTVIEAGKARYSEIDIVELTQRQNFVEGNIQVMDHNLHAILSNGKPGIAGREWRRPSAFKKEQANEYKAPFDPTADFHTYGCKVTAETIIWYVDGKEVGRKKNEFWHRKMNVALSVGIRAPFMQWKDNRLVITEDQKGNDGFPTSMMVDYIRVWELE